MEKTEKAAVISEVEDKLREAKTTVLADYRGLTVKEISQLRRELSAEGVDFKVYKNTLVKRAVDNSKIDDLGEHLVGPTAVAFSYEDPIAPIRLLAKFAKTNKALTPMLDPSCTSIVKSISLRFFLNRYINLNKAS